MSEELKIAIEGAAAVSGLWDAPPAAAACLVLAHGAGAGMAHKGMAALAEGLAAREIAVLRYQFPYMEAGAKRPDSPAIAHLAVRAAVAEARRRTSLPVFAGGRSFGGRMTSQAEAAAAMGLKGLVFFAFPLHPAGKPGTDRAGHLSGVHVPMLFLQGDADALAQRDLLEPVVASLPNAELHLEPFADHSFHAPAKSGRRDPEILTSILDKAATWMRANS